MDMKELEQIAEIAVGMRDIFERILQDSINTTETSGACLYAAILLANSIMEFTNAKARVCGGGPNEDAGIRDKQGIKRGHYWVEGQVENGLKFVADISSDQFGYPPVVVITEDHGRLRYFPGHQPTIDQHVREELDLCMKNSNVYTR
jgi:hypothetical protein